MLPAGLVGHVRLRYLGTSAQKARLVVDLIRGLPVERALGTLHLANKLVARDIGRALDSAVANARQRKPEIDVDRLFVHTAFVDGGPTLKRVRPAPMGRAFRILRRMCHVTIGLGEVPVRRPSPPPKKAGAPAETAEGAPAAAEGARAKAKTARRAAPRKPAKTGGDERGGTARKTRKARS